jgi:hypothetical protein
MEWTSTNTRRWQLQCGNFANEGEAFQLRDVTTEEHRRFVEVFAKHYELEVSVEGTTVTFFSRKDRRTGRGASC